MTRPIALFRGAFAVLLLASVSALAELPGGIRVTAEVEPARLKPGDTGKLSVTVHLPSGWIIYDLEQVPNSVLPTTLEIDDAVDVALLENFKSEGAKEDIEPKFGSRLARFFDRSPSFDRPIVVSPQARLGEHLIAGHIGFLAQHRPSKRFYVVSRAYFTARMLVELAPPPVTTDSIPTSTLAESPLTLEAAHALLEADRPVPRSPSPPFDIAIDADSSTPRFYFPWQKSLHVALGTLALVVGGFLFRMIVLAF